MQGENLMLIRRGSLLLWTAALLAGALALGAAPASAAAYTILDLDATAMTRLYGPTEPNAINASGQVAGLAYYSPEPHGFLNDLTGMSDLGALEGLGNISQAFAINDAGQMAGYSQVQSGRETHAWLFSGSIMRDLGTLGGHYSTAYDINNAGQVVGVAQTASQDPLDPYGEGSYHAFLYSDGVMRDLATMGFAGHSAQAINNRGQIVGASSTGVILWENGVVRSLGTLPGFNTISPEDINDAGQVVGWAQNYTNNGVANGRAFLYDGAAMRSLGTLGGNRSQALGINNTGQIVGWSWTSTNSDRRAFLYTGGTMVDLNTLLPPGSGWTLHEARAINDSGQIVGMGTLGGQLHAFLMTPGIDPRSLPPQIPGGLSVRTVSATELALAWTDHSNNEYRFEIQQLIDGTWEQIAQTPANTTGFAHTRLSSNALYRYRVRAINSTGASAWSDEAEATTLPYPPAAPGGLVATDSSATQLSLSWRDNSDNETAFVLWRRGAPNDWARIAVLAPNVTRYIDQGVSPETSFQYRVRAIGLGGASPWSNEVEATTLPLPPAAPTGLAAAVTSATQLDLAWTDHSDTETAFALFRKSGAGDWVRIAVLAPNITRYADRGLSPETSYTYRVRAIGLGGASAWSNEAAGTTPLAPPTGLMVRNGAPYLVYLEWTDNSRTETGFELYRRQGDGAWRLLATLPANNPAYFDFILEAGATYTYRVRTLGPAGPSGWSNEVRWTIPSTR
jgi:probable HAF family extracellular repeat protein